MVQIVRPEDSMAALEEMTGHAEKVLRYRDRRTKIILCTGDMGFGACKTYDPKFVPAQNTYREISSLALTSGTCARRGRAHAAAASPIKDPSGPYPEWFWSGGRSYPSRVVMENHQQAEGRTEVPEVLRPYMNGLEYNG